MYKHYVEFNPPFIILTMLHGSLQVEEKTQTFSPALSLVPEQGMVVAEKSQPLRRRMTGWTLG